MVKKFTIKQPKPSAAVIGKPQEKIVFGFSELRPFSYVDNHNDTSFFISFLDRLKKLCSLDWNTAPADIVLIKANRNNIFRRLFCRKRKNSYICRQKERLWHTKH